MLTNVFNHVMTRLSLLRQIGMTSLLIGSLTLSASAAFAQQYTQVDGYQIHYSAISTDFLSPDVAQAYNIQRSVGLGLVNVSVLKEQEDGSTVPVNASLDGSVSEITGSNEKPLGFKTVRENSRIYQLATFRLRHDEPMRFELDVRYDRNAEPASVSFVERFYIER